MGLLAQIPSGPVIDSEGLAVQTGSGAPVKKSYEEVHGKAALPREWSKIGEHQQKLIFTNIHNMF